MMNTVYKKSVSVKRRGRLVAIVLAFLIICGLLAVALTRTGMPDSIRSSAQNGNGQQEKASRRSDVDDVVFACSGRVEGLSEIVNLSAGVDGVLAAVRVKEGQQIAAGEVIALISCRDLEAGLQATRAAAESARQSRQRILRGSREEERRIAADHLAETEAVLKQVRLQERRMALLFDKGDVSKEALERSRRDAEVAEAAWRAAADRQTLVNASPLPEEIARADAEVNAAEEQVRTIAARLEKCAVRAPLSGTVLHCYLKPGEAVSAVFPQPIISLADTSRLRVRAEVDERDVGRIFLGQRALILADAFPEKRFAGEVSRVGALMGRKKVRTGDPAEKSDRDVLEVWVNLEETDARLVVGLRTSVQFFGNRINSVQRVEQDR